jgi:hypothetical protein
MSGSGATGGALAGVVLAFLGYSGLSFVALVLVAAVVIRNLLTVRASEQPVSTKALPYTYDI